MTTGIVCNGPVTADENVMFLVTWQAL